MTLPKAKEGRQMLFFPSHCSFNEEIKSITRIEIKNDSTHAALATGSFHFAKRQ